MHPVSTYRDATSLPIASSDQALLRPPRRVAYGCFLPDLTGFTTPRGTGPNLQGCLWERPCARWGPQHEEFRPAIADCGLQGTATSPPSTTFSCALLSDPSRWYFNPHQPVKVGAAPVNGEGGIRTHGALLAPTRSPGAPIRPLSHLSSSQAIKKAEREGFEPPVPVGTVDFESTAFNRSAISPWLLVPRVHATRWAKHDTASCSANAVAGAGSERTR